MHHSFEIDGVDHRLWLSNSQQGYRLHLRDQVITPVAFTYHSESSGILTIAGESEPVRFAIEGELIHLHIRGRARILRYIDPLRTLAPANDGTRPLIARAPMPGVVVATTVSPGQSVSAGMALMTIESMKLETIIRSPQDGIVDRVHVKEGESFEHDAVLVTLSKEGR
ncbi:acetyl-CoA carboxylase biotin carboxyl carrier protein subunit [Bradyrhizobium sp. Pear77]|uniref:acetyl-CoA carboxylase biotin carboxyl carrier protein subunit n=1 Tax=Bradyrhizobium TaxID=374 RepID=UPI0028A097AD|nr:acetyl-CoA carboxylase biotin carboxyl carrier protein subunit [Bradyrhizobium altum]MCC8959465.1 acetyl-CoA carboxylase biotin carboxyl carrier protein subunit [Bradyrhizobium altum]MCC8963714.1 acetyl-CoA carboxylase biotin carboxyl carrier protein subunit [Bradyrhizobium oropedii]